MNDSSVVLYMVLIASGALMAHGVDQRTATGVHGGKPNNGVYSWPTKRMMVPISIALFDGISWRDIAS